jgi:hypothetical protein
MPEISQDLIKATARELRKSKVLEDSFRVLMSLFWARRYLTLFNPEVEDLESRILKYPKYWETFTKHTTVGALLVLEKPELCLVKPKQFSSGSFVKMSIGSQVIAIQNVISTGTVTFHE